MSLSQNVGVIVEKTLTQMNVREGAWIKLVKGTFAAESGLKELFDEANDCYGFSMMHRDWLADILKSVIGPSKKLQGDILRATGVDTSKQNLIEILEAMRYNIAFQVAMTYCGYSSSYLLNPDDNIESLAKEYIKYWVQDDKDKEAAAHFKASYNEIFINK